MGRYQSSLSLWPSFLSKESLLHAITVSSQGISNLNAHISKFRGRKSGRLLKLPCFTNVELAVISNLDVLHLSHPGIIDLLPKIMFQRHQQLQKPTQAKRTWVPKKLYMEEQKTAEREIVYEETSFVNSFMQDLFRYLTLQLKKEGQDKKEDTHPQGGADLPSR
jgi:hypothetical protein